MPIGKSHSQYIAERLESEPEFAAEWEEVQLEDQTASALAAFREQQGMSQRTLAEVSGIKQPMIARIERGGQVPTITTFGKLIRALGAIAVVGGPEGIVLRPANQAVSGTALRSNDSWNVVRDLGASHKLIPDQLGAFAQSPQIGTRFPSQAAHLPLFQAGQENQSNIHSPVNLIGRTRNAGLSGSGLAA